MRVRRTIIYLSCNSIGHIVPVYKNRYRYVQRRDENCGLGCNVRFQIRFGGMKWWDFITSAFVLSLSLSFDHDQVRGPLKLQYSTQVSLSSV